MAAGGYSGPGYGLAGLGKHYKVPYAHYLYKNGTITPPP